MTSSALNSIKTFFGYRNRHYKSVSQIDVEESKSMMDENTSCIDDKNLIENNKPSFVDRTDNIHNKRIDEILPLINDASLNLKNIIQPISSYTNDTRPDVDALDC